MVNIQFCNRYNQQIEFELGKVYKSGDFKELDGTLYHVSSSFENLKAHELNSSHWKKKDKYLTFLSDFLEESDFTKATKNESIYFSHEDYRVFFELELYFEKVRASRFSLHPSRKMSIFASINFVSCKYWITKDKRINSQIFELFPLDDSLIAAYDVSWYDYALKILNGTFLKEDWILTNACMEDELYQAAENYWTGNEMPENQLFDYPKPIEVLLCGKFTVC